MTESPEPTQSGQILLYRTNDGSTRVDVRADALTLWMTQAALAELYQTTPQNITQHIRAIYADREHDEVATCKKYLQVQIEGGREVKRQVQHYNLAMILAVGFRVRSPRGTEFRQWAANQLRELLTKGFVMDDERLKEGRSIGQDYFDELLARIRDIRASEKRFYQKVRDLFTLAIDYDKDAETARQFFQAVQNKLLYAVTGMTAAEIIASRANREKANMGLISWKGSRVRKGDVATSKNYLSPDEIDELNRIVSMYLDFAEDRARRGIPMHMVDWKKRLDAFLQFNEREILTHNGKVSMEVAKQLALDEYVAFEDQRRQHEALEEDEADIAALSELIDHLEEDGQP